MFTQTRLFNNIKFDFSYVIMIFLKRYARYCCKRYKTYFGRLLIINYLRVEYEHYRDMFVPQTEDYYTHIFNEILKFSIGINRRYVSHDWSSTDECIGETIIIKCHIGVISNCVNYANCVKYANDISMRYDNIIYSNILFDILIKDHKEDKQIKILISKFILYDNIRQDNILMDKWINYAKPLEIKLPKNRCCIVL